MKATKKTAYLTQQLVDNTIYKELLDDTLDYLLDPVTGSPARNKIVMSIVLMNVDDLLIFGTKEAREAFLVYSASSPNPPTFDANLD